MIDCNESVITWKSLLVLQKKHFIFVYLLNYLANLLQQKVTGQYLKSLLKVKKFQSINFPITSNNFLQKVNIFNEFISQQCQSIYQTIAFFR